MNVSIQLHTPAALPLEKEPTVTAGREAGQISEPTWRRWRI